MYRACHRFLVKKYRYSFHGNKVLGYFVFQFLPNGLQLHIEVWKSGNWAKIHAGNVRFEKHNLPTPSTPKFKIIKLEWKKKILSNAKQKRQKTANRYLQARFLPFWLQPRTLSVNCM